MAKNREKNKGIEKESNSIQNFIFIIHIFYVYLSALIRFFLNKNHLKLFLRINTT